MASKRKRQVGGTIMMQLPRKITFRIYPQPGEEFTDSNDCASIRESCKLPKPVAVVENCDDKLRYCHNLASICPARWHTVTSNENIYVKIPKHFVVTATCLCKGVKNEVSYNSNVFNVLNDTNYTFKIEYAKDTANPDIYGVSDILGRTENNQQIHDIVVISQKQEISLDDLRKIMNYYFFRYDKKFVQYIGEFTESGSKSVNVIAWTDIRNENPLIQLPCSSIGQHSYKSSPPCADKEQYTLSNALKLGEVCS
jgi:hypothetical protein